METLIVVLCLLGGSFETTACVKGATSKPLTHAECITKGEEAKREGVKDTDPQYQPHVLYRCVPVGQPA